MKGIRNSRVYQLSLVGIILLTWLLLYFMNRPNENALAEGAKEFLEAVIAGDSKSVYQLTYKGEIQTNDLDEKDIALILDRIVRPLAERYDLQNKPVSGYMNNPMQGGGEVLFTLENGMNRRLPTSSYWFEGHEGMLLSKIIWAVYILEEQERTGQQFSLQVKSAAILYGLQRDYEILQKAGFTTFFTENPVNGTMTEYKIDDLIAKLKRDVAAG